MEARQQGLDHEAQPSTSTKSNSLKGNETSDGGSIIMPRDIRVELTTRSMTRNGTNMTKPMMNAVRISDRAKAGTMAAMGIAAGEVSLAPLLSNRARSSACVCFSIHVLSGAWASV